MSEKLRTTTVPITIDCLLSNEDLVQWQKAVTENPDLKKAELCKATGIPGIHCLSDEFGDKCVFARIEEAKPSE